MLAEGAFQRQYPYSPGLPATGRTPLIRAPGGQRHAPPGPRHTPAATPRSAHERPREGMLIDVVTLVRGGQDFALIDVVDAEGLQHLGLDEMSDPAFRHYRDRDRLHDALHDARI